jgi:anaerobic selenocysteine-containing dehydrogenase
MPADLPVAQPVERAPHPPREGVLELGKVPAERRPRPVAPKLRLVRYRPLFSGAAVERVPQLGFQRPEAVVELAPDDAEKRAIATGDTVTVRGNGTSVELRARVNRRLVAGAARAAEEHVRGLPDLVEVRP